MSPTSGTTPSAEAARAFADAFTSATRSRGRASVRQAGLELEFPVVDPDGRARPIVPVNVTLRRLAAHGWRASGPNTLSRPPRSYASPASHHVTTDMGASTLELQVAPTDDLGLLEAETAELVAELVAVLARLDLRLLGYGVQPVSTMADVVMTAGERYEHVLRDSLPRKDGARWGGLISMSASNQVHVDVSPDEAASVATSLNRTAALRIAVMANSPHAEGLPGEGLGRREVFWDRAFGHRPRQYGVLPASHDLTSYTEVLLDTDAIMVSRGGGALRLTEPATWRDLLAAATPVTAVDVHDDRHQVSVVPTDLRDQVGAGWFCARLSPRWGTVEDRVSCAQPPGAHVSNAALVLGLVQRHRDVLDLVAAHTHEQCVMARDAASREGFAAAFGARPIAPLVEELLEVARVGLADRDRGEERHLDVLRARARTRSSPASALMEVAPAARTRWIMDHLAL